MTGNFTIFIVVVVYYFIFLFYLGQIPTVAMMRALLPRRLKKLTVPALWRSKHDYFPRTLKLHNGGKVRWFFTAFKVIAYHASARKFRDIIWIFLARNRALSENFENRNKCRGHFLKNEPFNRKFRQFLEESQMERKFLM